MQEKESIMAVQWELKIPSLRITVRHHEAYPRDGIFNPHLTIIKDSFILTCRVQTKSCSTTWALQLPDYPKSWNSVVTIMHPKMQMEWQARSVSTVFPDLSVRKFRII